MKARDLKQLKSLTDMLFQAELARLKQTTEAVRAVEAQAAGHREARARRSRELAELESPDPATLAAADGPWLGWTDRELKRIQSDRARLEVEMEQRRKAARRAFGRGQALDTLSERLAAEAAKRAARRAE